MMKKIIVILLISFCTNVNAQTNTTFNKFVGTWRWVSGTDTVVIVLETQNVQIYPGFNKQALVGWHKYVKNGLQIQSSMQYVGRDENLDYNTNATDMKNTLLGHPKNSNSIWFTTFWDLTLHRNFYLYFSLLPGSTTQAEWKLRAVGNSASYANSCFSCILPKNLTLTKQ